MLKFKIFSAMGASVNSACREGFFGIHGSFVVAANSRVVAFIKLFRHLTQQGNDVTVLRVNETPNALNFSSNDLAAIHAAGIAVRVGYPKSGFQIEDIVPA
jgi:hypothetical protein